MKQDSVNSFGMVIAYIVPGFTALWGVSHFSETVNLWLRGSPVDAPTVGGFLYITIGSIAAGLTASTVRWALVDTLHHRTGISPPEWDFSLLQKNIDAFDVLVQIHYRYYQFYGNMLVAVVTSYLASRLETGFWVTGLGWHDLGFVALAAIFFAGSRDTLAKYYDRTAQLLDTPRRDAKAVINSIPPATDAPDLDLPTS